jgi:hypothetical protein
MEFVFMFWPWLFNYPMSQKSRMECEVARSFPNTAYWSVSLHPPLAYTNQLVILSLGVITFLSIITFMWWKWICDCSDAGWKDKRNPLKEYKVRWIHGTCFRGCRRLYIGACFRGCRRIIIVLQTAVSLRAGWLQLEFGVSTSTGVLKSPYSNLLPNVVGRNR